MNQIRDLHNAISVENGRTTAAITTNSTNNGAIIDLQGAGGVEWVLTVSARTDGTYTPSIQVGNDSGLSDAATADSTTVSGALTAVTANGVTSYGLARTTFRYARLVITSTVVTSGATVGATAIKYDLGQAGVA
jgi:hypothetical protein